MSPSGIGFFYAKINIMKNLLTDKPLYKHDCEKCVYLGSAQEKDFYFCNKSLTGRDSLVIRLSDKPSDYLSMPVEVAKGGIISGEINDSTFELAYHLYRVNKLLKI